MPTKTIVKKSSGNVYIVDGKLFTVGEKSSKKSKKSVKKSKNSRNL